MIRAKRPAIVGALAGLGLAGAAAAGAQAWTLTEVTAAAGIDYVHGWLPGESIHEAHVMSGGVAAGDVDRDGQIDLLVVTGNLGDPLLLRNQGNGHFETMALTQLGLSGRRLNAPGLFDLDGDGWLELFFGGIEGEEPRVFRNLGHLAFEDQTLDAGFRSSRETWSSAAADYDRDGDLDLAMGHWSRGPVIGVPSTHLWRNDTPAGGPLRFAPVDFQAGIAPAYQLLDFSFTPNWVDLDADGWPDLVMAGDFGSTRIFRNRGDGTFEDHTDPSVITDENGMGLATGDVDGDLDFDVFITSIWDPDGVAEGNWGITGNRLYQNGGNGELSDVTTASGTREGYWGWGACLADFDNDGDPDLVHTNGFPVEAAADFGADPDRLFLNDGQGVFVEAAAAHGLNSTGQGRGIACFDLERDGDLDVFIAQNAGPPWLYRNDGPPNTAAFGRAFLRVVLQDDTSGNRAGVGAWVEVAAGNRVQRQAIQAGAHFVSQSPAEAFFGLGEASVAQRVTVIWPDGERQELFEVATSRTLRISRSAPPAVDVPLGGLAPILLGAGLAFFGIWTLVRERKLV